MRKFLIKSNTAIDKLFKSKKINKVSIICGKNSYKISGAKSFLNKLLKNKKKKVFLKKSIYPEFNELTSIINFIKRSSPDLIIAIGGGSVLDYAKIANVLDISNNLKKEIKTSNYKIKKKHTKLLAIPTTAGSGAEVTSNAVIYIDKVKFSIEHKLLKPDFYLLVPQLVMKASKSVKSSAGLDAIAQAIESLISKKSNNKSVQYAKMSLKISKKNFLKFLYEPNIKNTLAMSLAANLAGKAINISKTTAPHAISYPFTAKYKISHGHAVSLTLNKFIVYNYNNLISAKCNFNLRARYNILFNIFEVKNIESLDKYLKNIIFKAGLEIDFKKLGINIKTQYRNIISGVNVLRLKNNPIKLDKGTIKNILFNNY